MTKERCLGCGWIGTGNEKATGPVDQADDAKCPECWGEEFEDVAFVQVGKTYMVNGICKVRVLGLHDTYAVCESQCTSTKTNIVHLTLGNVFEEVA